MTTSEPDDPKTLSLREQGSLNPRPKAVTDDLFSDSEFFDARDLVQVKYEMLRRAQQDGRPITQAAQDFGFSRPVFYQAQEAFAAGGLPALVPRKRGPKGSYKLTDEVMDFIMELRNGDPSLRPVELAARIGEHFGVSVHPRTIERGLRGAKKKP